MAQAVSRDWRRRSHEVRHTREVHTDALPPDAMTLLLEMASTIERQNLRLIEIEKRLSAIEAIEIDKTLLRGAA